MSTQNNHTVFPSTRMLPMEDISKELQTIHGFAKSDQKAVDTEKVDGVTASHIAVIALDENNEPFEYKDGDQEVYINNRETVKNSLYLDGVKAEDYLTKIEGAVIQNFGEQVATTYADELAALRDELYQLRGELTRNGFVKEFGLYSGFQDFFKDSDKKYRRTINLNGEETIELCGLSPSFVNSTNVNKIIPSQPGLIKKGDWFIISKKDVGEHYLVVATDVVMMTTEEEITFESSISSEGIPSIDNPSEVVIAKVSGNYVNGTFSFSEVKKNSFSDTEKYTMLNDDTDVHMQSINANKTGFGGAFKIPKAVEGGLKRFGVMSRITGSPGALVCYIIEERNISNVTNLSTESVGEDKIIFAKSKPVFFHESSKNTVQEISFSFEDPITNNYPVLSGNDRYCFVMVAETASSTDFWELQFSRNPSLGSDVQTNNKSYEYTQGVGIVERQTIGDLIFTLVTAERRENVEVPNSTGLYTSEQINVGYNKSLAKVRLTLRVEREGIFTSKTKGIVNDNGVIKVATTGMNPDNLGIKANDTLIIGNHIRKAMVDINSKTISIDKAVLVEEGDPIYRVGYKPYINAIKNTWVTGADNRYEIEEDITLPLELIAVMPDRHKISDKVSDRLVFECDLRDEEGLPIDANQFVLQVVWKSNLTPSEIANSENYVGRIHDLTLSFDRTL